MAGSWFAVIGLTVAAIPTLIGVIVARKKSGPDAADVITTAAARLIINYENRIKQLENENLQCAANLAAHSTRISRLEKVITKLGGEID